MIKRYSISQNTHGLEMTLSTGVNVEVCLSDDVEKLEEENARIRCCMNCRRYSRDEIHDSIIEFCGVDDDLPLELFCDKWSARL